MYMRCVCVCVCVCAIFCSSRGHKASVALEDQVLQPVDQNLDNLEPSRPAVHFRVRHFLYCVERQEPTIVKSGLTIVHQEHRSDHSKEVDNNGVHGHQGHVGDHVLVLPPVQHLGSR